ncbi:MAG: glycerophosphodiester phosphodiesterase family protein [Rhodospirillales bacterium]
MNRPLSIAHRGYSSRYPENTLTAHAEAIKAGADMVEVDTRFSRDGDIFCLHDPDLERLTGDRRMVADCTTRELREIRISNDERLMTLPELLNLVDGRTGIMLDIKLQDDAMTFALLDCVMAAGQMSNTWFGVRSCDQLCATRKMAPAAQCLAMLSDYSEAEAWIDAGATAVRIWESQFTQELEDRLAPKIPIWITVGGRGTSDLTGDIPPERLRRLAARRVTAILLNDPTLFDQLVPEPVL